MYVFQEALAPMRAFWLRYGDTGLHSGGNHFRQGSFREAHIDHNAGTDLTPFSGLRTDFASLKLIGKLKKGYQNRTRDFCAREPKLPIRAPLPRTIPRIGPHVSALPQSARCGWGGCELGARNGSRAARLLSFASSAASVATDSPRWRRGAEVAFGRAERPPNATAREAHLEPGNVVQIPRIARRGASGGVESRSDYPWNDSGNWNNRPAQGEVAIEVANTA